MKLFLDLLDKLISLLKERKEERARLYSDILSPLFEELQPVIADTIRLFKDASRMIDSDTQWEEAAELIWDRRSDMLLARIKVREMAKTLRETTDNEMIEDLCDSIIAVFYSATREDTVSNGRMPSSDIEILYDLFRYMETGNLNASVLQKHSDYHHPAIETARAIVSRNELREFINAAVENLEENWTLLAKNFSRAKTHLLTANL